jgi:hypothetical protein
MAQLQTKTHMHDDKACSKLASKTGDPVESKKRTKFGSKQWECVQKD